MQKGFIQLIAISLISALLAAGAVVAYDFSHPRAIAPQTQGIEGEPQTFGSNNAVGGKVYTLTGSGVSSSATSLGLTSFQIAGGTQKLQMTDFGDLGCATIQPGNSTKQEFVSFTGVTQNADGTATLTGVSRGLAPIPPYTASTTLQYSHAGGSQLVISNSPPCFYEGYAQLTQNEGITGLWNFNPIPLGFGTATSSSQLATRGYVEGIAIQGAATSTENQQGIGRLTANQLLGTSQASSTTADGGVPGQPLILKNSQATSSPYQAIGGTGKFYLVTTQGDGTISKNFFGQILATSTVVATSSIGILNVGQLWATSSVSQLNLNGISYTFPQSQNGSSTVLSTNGNGTLSWEIPGLMEIASTTLSGAANTITLSNIPARNILKIYIDFGVSSGASAPHIQFNGDTAGNYTYSVSANSAASVASTSKAMIGLASAGYGETNGGFFVMDITNLPTRPKYLTWIGGGRANAASDDVEDFTGAGAWVNSTAQITSITLTMSGSFTIPAGSRIIVYGSAR